MSLEADIPFVAGPMVNPNGTPTQAWWAFFRQLWVRTGSGPGISADELALLGALGSGPAETDPTARGEALAAYLTALQPAARPVDFTQPELFALSLFGSAPRSTSQAGAWRAYGSLGGLPAASQELFSIEMVGDEVFEAGLPQNLGSCDAAPTADVSLPITINGTPSGSMDVAMGATTATWTFPAAYAAARGDRFGFFAPTVADASFAGPRYTFIGRRV